MTQEVGGSSPLFHPQQDMVFNGLACMVWDHISCERHIMVDYATLIRSSRWFDSTRSYILFRKECIIHDKPEWRNWQTRLTQNQIPKGVWVRLPLWVYFQKSLKTNQTICILNIKSLCFMQFI